MGIPGICTSLLVCEDNTKSERSLENSQGLTQNLDYFFKNREGILHNDVLDFKRLLIPDPVNSLL